MDYQESRQLLQSVRRDIDQADELIRCVANLLRGRLRSSNVNSTALRDLKRELRNFNMHTGTWKQVGINGP